ncbi:hypothetical protein LOC71_20120 [Rhodopirellula sp. JC740]|uniref:NolW-like domain-containing protein n=1 Tax=Rhodopirellula halodulae TaxID=2894198 RepID=A0ABS8NNS4_9BACT|nr:secretin N-terminal domain-containing protein [Rhodopirellula sp. JC740]MCC9644587.1 hypothetical protein [Rhodopirellula sp. JC740]
MVLPRSIAVQITIVLLSLGSAHAQSGSAVGSGGSESQTPKQTSQSFRFTFQDAPWPDVLAQFAEWSGLTLDLTDTPPGDFSYYDNRSHSTKEAIDILNGYLLPRGHVLLQRDQFLVCLKTDNPMLANLIPTISVEQLDQYGENNLLRVIVPLEKIDAETAAEEVRGVLGPFGEATALESSRSVVLQGFGSGLRQSLDILRISRPPVTDDKLEFRSYEIVHLLVADAEKQVRNLFGVKGPAMARNVSGARSEIERSRYYRERGGRGGRDDENQSAPPIPLLEKVAMNMQISSLDRTNTLLVTATPEGLALVEEVLQSIDVPNGQTGRDWAASSEPDLRVYGMISANEGEVAKTIDVLMPGVIVNEDSRQDTIHVYGTDEQHQEVERLIRILDINEGGSRTVEVIPLRRSNPSAAANFLNELFANADRDERPSIQAELASRSVIVRGTENQVEEVRAALMKLGESGRAGSIAGRGPGIRRVQVGSSNARSIAEAARQVFSDGPSNQPQIRIVVPGQHSPDRDPATSDPPEQSTDEWSMPNQDMLHRSIPAETAPQTSGLLEHETAYEQSRDADTLIGTTYVALPSSNEKRSKVQVIVDGDELIISSGDPGALQAVEGTIRELARQMPARKTWTVFYLRVAEASKAATQLTDLIYEPNSAGLTSGVFLADTSSDSIRIVPDKRTNSLLINGTAEQLVSAERFLEIIDATEVPGSFIDRKPHAIKVEYANVNEIAELIRTLYKDYLVDPAAERARAARSSRRGRDNDDDDDDRRERDERPVVSSDQNDSPGIRLTLAVDEQTQEILVACNDQLFEEIQTVVKERDTAASQNQPVVQTIDLPPGTEAEVLRALQIIGADVTTTDASSTDLFSRRITNDRSGRRDDERRRER